MNTKPNIDFSISSNPYWIRVADYSLWNLIEDKPSIIEITMPGYEGKVTKYFDKHKTNGFNSVILGINCHVECGEYEKLTLPDGIYTIKVIGSPSKFNKEKKYLKDDLLQMELDKVYINSIEKDCYFKIEADLTEAEFLLRAAHAYLRFDNIKLADSMFQQAVKISERLKDCSCE